MESYIVEWLNLLGRWVHIITGVAWIGASFYFIWLDNHLQAPEHESDSEKGVSGEVWSVHGGGFYHAQKYKVAPPKLPDTLHWFKWEAYTTWLSGMFMLILIYWYQAELYLIDPNVLAFGKPLAVFAGMVTIAGGWLIYDILCKSPIGQNETKLAAVLFVLLTVIAWLLCQLFSGRGAFMHFGAMLGTIMVGNVFFVIMPGQRDLVAAKAEDRQTDPKHAIMAKQRSVHNTYFTLPVLLIMVSNHYAMTYGSAYNWLILMALCLAGALIRVYFVKRHFGKASIVPMVVALAILAATAAAMAPRSKPAPVNAQDASSDTAATGASASITPTFADIQGIIEARCTNCHAATPTYVGFTAAPKGIALDSAEEIVKHAAAIHQQSVLSKAMPLANLTKMTDDERAAIGSWFNAGAKAE